MHQFEDDGGALLEHVRQLGCEGIVSKRATSRYKGGPSRDWVKTKCSQTGRFVVTGFVDESPGKLDHIRVAEIVEDELVPGIIDRRNGA